MFVLKKILGHLLMPLPLGLGLVTLGFLLILLRRRLRGWLLLTFGWLVLALASNRAVSLAITASLEKTYPPVPPLSAAAVPGPAAAPGGPPSPEETPVETAFAEPGPLVRIEPAASPGPAPAIPAGLPGSLRAAAFVAVLGGGHGGTAALPAGQRLSPSARARLVEGLRIALALPDAWLVVSGPGNDPYHPQGSGLTHARTLADAAVELGFPRERIVEIDTARDTAEEVDALRLLAGEERVALVTSAWHLPRAMKLAAAARLDAFPCPADYLGGRDEQIGRLAYVTWDADSLANTTRAWREYVGQAWAALVGRWRNQGMSGE